MSQTATATATAPLELMPISANPSSEFWLATTRKSAQEQPPIQTALPVGPSTGPDKYATRNRAYLIIAHLTLATSLTSVTTGMITTAIPKMAADLSIPSQTYYWPLSVYGLTSGACLLVAGSVADIVGSKRVFLVGNLLLSAFILGCGLAQTDIQLVMFRAMQGIAVALCLPTSVGVLTNAIAPGRRRNLGLACTGLGQPLGFSAGLVMGGVFIDTVGWRVGWYTVAAVYLALVPAGFYLLPADNLAGPASLHALRTKVDWVGAAISSASLSMLAYVLVQISESETSLVHNPGTLALLVISLALLPAFAWWAHFAAKRGWPVLIPNRLWRLMPFTSVCLSVLLSYAVIQTMELFCTLFFQNVQGFDALQSSIRLLPSALVGILLNLATGLVVHRVTPMNLVLVSSLGCAGASLLMALINPEWPYWYGAFPAQILLPVSSSSLSWEAKRQLLIRNALCPRCRQMSCSVWDLSS